MWAFDKDAAVQQAVLSLTRWRKEGIALGPQNKAHIEAYLLARKNCQRVRAKMVVRIIQDAEMKVSSSASFTTKFVLAQKSLLACQSSCRSS